LCDDSAKGTAAKKASECGTRGRVSSLDPAACVGRCFAAPAAQSRVIRSRLAVVAPQGKGHPVCLLRQSDMARIHDNASLTVGAGTCRRLELVGTQPVVAMVIPSSCIPFIWEWPRVQPAGRLVSALPARESISLLDGIQGLEKRLQGTRGKAASRDVLCSPPRGLTRHGIRFRSANYCRLKSFQLQLIPHTLPPPD
jgi:hypothetical protein